MPRTVHVPLGKREEELFAVVRERGKKPRRDPFFALPSPSSRRLPRPPPRPPPAPLA
jgi:hypothetical protein